MTSSRRAAAACLSDILKSKGRPKEALDFFSQQLDRRDRAFTMEIVYGVLRNLYVLDRIMGTFVRDRRRLQERTINNLRIALYQILFMRVPDFAVVHEAVEAEKRGGTPSLVNAVLRTAIRNRKDITLPIPLDDPAEDISVNTSHPKWMVKRWMERYGISGAREVGEANNAIPPLAIRTNTLKVSREELLRMLADGKIPASPTAFSPDGIIIDGPVTFEDLTPFHGRCFVQDEASQLISYLLSPRPGDRVLDACAAPGGKTTHLAQLMHDRGEIIALDKDPRRIRKLEENIRSCGIHSVKVIRDDIAQMNGLGIFDGILLDAPCSATGVIRRNPDVRYRHTRRSIIDFGKRQTDLLKAVAPLLRTGGRLVYSVCSVEPEEGEAVVRDFLNDRKEFRIIDAYQEFLTPFMKNGFFRTYPHAQGLDGFFGVILCKEL